MKTTLKRTAILLAALLLLWACKKDDPAPTPTVNYTVTFNSTGGSAVGAQTIRQGQRAEAPGNPTWQGYTFQGWYTDAGLQNEFDFDTPITANITLYARWNKNEAFVSRWKTDASYTNAFGSPINAQEPDRITLPLVNNGIYDFTVDWGDGTQHTIAQWDAPEKTHVYTTPGTYTVTVIGTIIGFGFEKTFRINDNMRRKIESNAAKLIEISDWGSLVIGDTEGHQFANTRNLSITAANSPNLDNTTNTSYMFEWSGIQIPNLNGWDVSNITDMSGMFGSSNFNGAVDNWDVSKVINMNGMFSLARSFNHDIGKWDVANVTDMSRMFWNAEVFDQDIGDWEVGNVTSMNQMFVNATNFNQDIGDWEVDKVMDMGRMFWGATSFNYRIDDWNVAEVIYMYGMFWGATSFNQPLNNWNVSKVERMDNMFFLASKFNQPLNKWNVAEVTDMGNMFNGASAFDQNLSLWNVDNVTSKRLFLGVLRKAYEFSDIFKNSAMENKQNQWPEFKDD